MDRAAFKPERFRVELQSSDASSSGEPVIVQIGLDGLKVFSADGFERSLRVYALSNISRWVMRGSTMLLYTKTPSDLEEKAVSFAGDSRTVQSMLDTLTSSCMQMCELLQSGEMSGTTEAVNQLSSLVKGGGRKKSSKSHIAAEDVEFWHGAEKEGWMYSQGEIVKTWRRRFFVLKQGYLFRFASADLDSTLKPRGIVSLKDVTDISDGHPTTGKRNSLKLSTATSHICYYADSETDMVEWMSALEKCLSEIVKRAAGMDDEEPRSSRSGSKANRTHNDMLRDLVKGYDSMSGNGGGREHDKMVNVVGYDSFSATAPPATPTSFGNSGGASDGRLKYGDIDGIAGIANTGSSNTSPIVNVNYGGALNNERPSFTPPAYTPQSSNTGHAPYMPPSNMPPYGSQGMGMYPSASIIDQPQLQPSYPAFQSTQASYMTSAPSNPNPHQWQVYFTPEGKAYYHNQATGHVQWEKPAELAM